MATTGKIKGNAWHLYKNVSGTYTKFGEVLSSSLGISIDTIDMTTKDSNEFQELVASIKRAEVSVEGIVRYDGSNQNPNDILEDALGGTEITVLAGTNASGDKYVKFNALFTNIEFSSSFDDKLGFSASMSSTGDIDLITKT